MLRKHGVDPVVTATSDRAHAMAPRAASSIRAMADGGVGLIKSKPADLQKLQQESQKLHAIEVTGMEQAERRNGAALVAGLYASKAFSESEGACPASPQEWGGRCCCNCVAMHS